MGFGILYSCTENIQPNKIDLSNKGSIKGKVQDERTLANIKNASITISKYDTNWVVLNEYL